MDFLSCERETGDGGSGVAERGVEKLVVVLGNDGLGCVFE